MSWDPYENLPPATSFSPRNVVIARPPRKADEVTAFRMGPGGRKVRLDGRQHTESAGDLRR